MSGGGGTNTVQTQSGPPQQFLDAYQNVVDRAQGVASQPYQSYTGTTVAPLSANQNNGIALTQQAVGAAQPYIDQAGRYISASTQPLLSGVARPDNAELYDLQNAAMGNLTQASGPNIANAANNGVGWVGNATQAATTGIGQAGTQGAAGINRATGTGVQGINVAGQSFNPNSIQQFLDPYTQKVVNATQAEFNNQNAQAQQGLISNAISSGAWGGDRAGVAQGIMAGQQALAQAPVIAGLESQGYQQATSAAETQAAQRLQAAQASGQLGLAGSQAAGQLGLSAAQGAGALGLQGYTTAAGLGLQGAQAMAQQQQQAAQQELGFYSGQQNLNLGANQAQGWLNSQAGFGMGNLGNEALNSQLTGANALMNVGGIEQQQEQANLNVPYEQYVAQRAYPFQTTGWLANIAEGLGSAAGGTSSTTSPGPSGWSQALGGIAAGTGILANTGAFGSDGWISGLANDLTASSGAAGGAAGAADFALGSGLYRRGGSIPYRGIGGGIGGTPYGSTIPNQAASIVPAGAPPGHGGGLLNSSTGSTSTSSGGGGGNSTASTLGTIASIAGIAAMFLKNGGGIAAAPRRALGGDLGDYGPSQGYADATMMGESGMDPFARNPRSSATGAGQFLDRTWLDLVNRHQPTWAQGMDTDQVLAMRNNPTVARQMVNTFAHDNALQLASAGDPVNDSTLALAHRFGAGGAKALMASDPGTPVGAVVGNQVMQANPDLQGRTVGEVLSGLRSGHQQPQGIAAAYQNPTIPEPPVAPQTSPIEPFQAPTRKSDWGNMLLDVGLGIMAGRSPNGLQNIGSGALQGLHIYNTEQDRQHQEDSQDAFRAYQSRVGEQRATEQNYRDQLGAWREQVNAQMSGARLAQTSQHNEATEQLQAQRLSQMADDAAKRFSLESQRADQADRRQDETERRNQANEDMRSRGLDIRQQGADIRQQTLDEMVKQHGVANDRAAQTQLQNQIGKMSDQALHLYLGSKDPITGKFGMTPEEAERQAQGFRDRAAGVPPPAAPLPAPAQAPVLIAPKAAPPVPGDERPPLSTFFGQ